MNLIAKDETKSQDFEAEEVHKHAVFGTVANKELQLNVMTKDE